MFYLIKNHRAFFIFFFDFLDLLRLNFNNHVKFRNITETKIQNCQLCTYVLIQSIYVHMIPHNTHNTTSSLPIKNQGKIINSY